MVLNLQIALLMACLAMVYVCGRWARTRSNRTLEEIKTELRRKPESLASVLRDCPFSAGIACPQEDALIEVRGWRSFYAIYRRLPLMIEGIEYVQTQAEVDPLTARRARRLKRSARRLRLIVVVAFLAQVASIFAQPEVSSPFTVQALEQYSMLSALVNLLIRDCFPSS